jgi:hypothetical protein
MECPIRCSIGPTDVLVSLYMGVSLAGLKRPLLCLRLIGQRRG